MLPAEDHLPEEVTEVEVEDIVSGERTRLSPMSSFFGNVTSGIPKDPGKGMNPIGFIDGRAPYQMVSSANGTSVSQSLQVLAPSFADTRSASDRPKRSEFGPGPAG
jgi:hypothetical protein